MIGAGTALDFCWSVLGLYWFYSALGTKKTAVNENPALRVVRLSILAVTLALLLTDWLRIGGLHLEILKYLREENVFGAVAFHAVAGFLGRGRVHTAHLVEAGGELPVVVSFVDTNEHVSRVLPKLKEMAAHRLIVRENVVLEQGSLD